MSWTEIAWNLLYALLILVAGNVLSAWLRDAAALALDRSPLDMLVRRLIVSTVRPVVLAITVFAALAQLGIPMTTFAAMAGAVTLAIGLSLQGSLSNVASGAMLLSLRPFDVGDRIEAAGHEGIVSQLGLFHTRLHANGNTVTLPNDAVWSKAITNFGDLPTRRIDQVYTLVHDSDAQQAEALLLKLLDADERVLAQPPALVRYAVDDLGVVLTSQAHVANIDFQAVRSDQCRDALAAFKEAGIRLASRIR